MNDQLLHDLKQYMGSGAQAARTGRRFKWRPGLQVSPQDLVSIRYNSDGSIDSSSLAVQYLIESTTFIRPRVIAQKFYEISIADYMNVDVGNGGWENEIVTNAVGIIGGTFSAGCGPADNSGPTQIPRVDVGLYPLRARIKTWKGAYGYAIDEINVALAADNFDLITARMQANRKLSSLGLQDVAMLGLETDLANFPGIYSNEGVTINNTLIDVPISQMSSTDFQNFVSLVLGAYQDNVFYTEQPDRFLVPTDDFMGLGSATAAGFPVGTKLDYLLSIFKKLTNREDFQILPSRYGMAARNAGFWSTDGTNRYVLYNSSTKEGANPDGMTVKLDVPIKYTLNPVMSADGFNWNGVAYMRFSGGNIYRVPEVLYFDQAS